MKILITGVCGFVGSTLATELRRGLSNLELIGLDNYSRAGAYLNRQKLLDLGVQLIHADLRCAEDVEALPRCDVVIDAAANPSVLAGTDGRTTACQLMQHNLVSTLNLLEYCRSTGAGFVLLSTSRVYSIRALSEIRTSDLNVEESGGRKLLRCVPSGHFPDGFGEDGIRETFSTNPPLSLYGVSKHASELLALEYGNQYEFPVWINRCGVMAGAGQFGHPGQGIVAYWIHAFREGKPLRYIGYGGSGRQVRDVVHPRDLIPLLEKQIRSRERVGSIPQIINVAGGMENSFSLAELTSWCRERFPNSATGEPDRIAECRTYDLPWVVLDSALAYSAWGWKAETSLNAILEEIAAFAEENKNWLSQTS